MEELTRDKKLLKVIEYALKNGNVQMLFKASEILNKRAYSEIVYKELMESFDKK